MELKKKQTRETTISDAIEKIRDFIRQTTGKEAADSEIADALTRYFVLKEIKDHIQMKREGSVNL